MKTYRWLAFLVWLLLGWGLWARGGFTFSFLFYSYSFIAIYGLCIRWIGLSGVRVSRAVLRTDGTEAEDATFTAGEEAVVEVTLERPWPLPIPWLVVRERLGDAEYDLLHGAWLSKKTSYQFILPLPERGVFPFAPVEMWAGDPFGIVTHRCYVRTGQREIAVAPAPRIYGSEAEMMMLALGEGVRGSARPGGEEGSDYRLYREGDALTRVMWKMAARTGEWFVRRFEAANAGESTAILIDRRSLSGAKAADRAAEAAAGAILVLGSRRRQFRLLADLGPSVHWRRALAELSPDETAAISSLPAGTSAVIVICADLSAELADACCRWQANGRDVLVLAIRASDAPLAAEWVAWLHRGGVRLMELLPQGERLLAEGGAAYGALKAFYSS